MYLNLLIFSIFTFPNNSNLFRIPKFPKKFPVLLIELGRLGSTSSTASESLLKFDSNLGESATVPPWKWNRTYHDDPWRSAVVRKSCLLRFIGFFMFLSSGPIPFDILIYYYRSIYYHSKYWWHMTRTSALGDQSQKITRSGKHRTMPGIVCCLCKSWHSDGMGRPWNHWLSIS